MATFVTRPATIAAGESMSGVVDCSDMGSAALCAIIMPDDWTSSGGITFQVSFDNLKYVDLYRTSGEPVTIAACPGGAVLVDADLAKAVRFMRLQAGTSQQPIEQEEDREFGVVLVSEATAPAAAASGAKAPRTRAARRKTPRKTAKPRRKHR